MGDVESEAAKVMLDANNVMSIKKMTTMRQIKAAMAIILFRLCRVFRIELTEMYQPNMAATKNNPAVTK